ncbi:MAG: hypothetical protein M0R49_13705 [Limnochordia bacterium]|nr:hypothetical protein [Limnochordia bacterium]
MKDRLPAVFSWPRFLMHLPIGVLVAVIALSGIWTGYFATGIACAVLTVVGFFVYEITEDWRIRDHAYIDLAGLNAGMWIVFGIYLVWSVL